MTTLGSTPKKQNKKKNKKKKGGGGGGSGGATLGGPPPAAKEEVVPVLAEEGQEAKEEQQQQAAPAQATTLGGSTLGGGGGSSETAAKKKKKKKKKKGGGGAAAAPEPAKEAAPKESKMSKRAAKIRAQVEAQRAAEEEAARLAEEEAAELKRIEEEEAAAAAVAAELKEKKRLERLERQKAQKEQREKQRQEELLRARLEKYGSDPRPARKDKKKEKARREAAHKAAEEKRAAEAAAAAEEAARKAAEEEAAAAAAAEAEDSPLLDDWEDALDLEIDIVGGSEDDSENEEKDEDGEDEGTAKQKTGAEPEEDAAAAVPMSQAEQSNNALRAPILCLLGHVDTGKTSLLDKIRNTHVQEGEAGGITQQIGATWFPVENVMNAIRKVAARKKLDFAVPGLLIVDTPGHEAFANLRSRGSGLCDFAILVVDLMAGLEQQTIESIGLLKMRKTPFVVALNKVDRVYSWKSVPNGSSAQGWKKQDKNVQQDFQGLVNRVKLQMAEQGLNTELYWQNKDLKGTINMVPTSAHTGEGIADLLMVITQVTQRFLSGKVEYRDELQATVLEVKPVQGLGTTIDVILVNGTLHRGDRIVLAGLNGPIVTTIKSLLTPQPMKELRVRTPYEQHQMIRAAQGLKVLAPGHDLEKAVPGSPLYVVRTEEEEEEACDEVAAEFKKLRKTLNRDGTGVYVQSSTLGALEALLHFLHQSKIPVVDFGVGDPTKTDVIKAGAMHTRKLPEYACMLCFDVEISDDVRREANKADVRIFQADIIYHLQENFTAYLEEIQEAKRTAAANEAVFPCVLDILEEHIFNNKSPIIMGVRVVEGVLHLNTPIVVPDKNMLLLGKVSKIELNRVEKTKVPQGSEVSISIEGTGNYCYGRHFDASNQLQSRITRRSIDAIKSFFKDQLTRDQAVLLAKLKKKQGV